MSLPACQERTLSGIEGALKASEPHLASMFAIFARLNQGEPVGAEPLGRERLRWLRRPRTAASAIVLIPVMFAAIIAGALLGGSARGATSCIADGVSALMHRPSCPQPGATASVQPAAMTTAPANSAPAKSASAKTAQAKTAQAKTVRAMTAAGAKAEPGQRSSSCTAVVPAVRFATMNGGDQALSPPARTPALTAGLSAVC
jgi:hypothetical protein